MNQQGLQSKRSSQCHRHRAGPRERRTRRSRSRNKWSQRILVSVTLFFCSFVAKPRGSSAGGRESSPAVPFRESHNGITLRFMALPLWHAQRAPDKLRPLSKFLRADPSTTCKPRKKYLSNPLLYKVVTSRLWKSVCGKRSLRMVCKTKHSPLIEHRDEWGTRHPALGTFNGHGSGRSDSEFSLALRNCGLEL